MSTDFDFDFNFDVSYDGTSHITVPELEGEKILERPDEDLDFCFLDTEHFTYSLEFDPSDTEVFTRFEVSKVYEPVIQYEDDDEDYSVKLTYDEAVDIVSYVIETCLDIEDFDVHSDSTDLLDENEIPEDETRVDIDRYADCPFVMEVVNYEVISYTAEFQKKVFEKLLQELNTTEDQFIEYLEQLSEYETSDLFTDSILSNYDPEFILDIFFYDSETRKMKFSDFGPYDLSNGGDLCDLIESLGFCTCENVYHDPYGIDSNGVVYCTNE